MATTVQSVIDRVQSVLQDTTGVRWPVTGELVLWVNDAQQAIVLLKPDASATSATVTLAEGTRQAIPADGHRLLNVVRNMSAASGGTGRRAIRLVKQEALDTSAPRWHDPSVTGTAAHGSEIKHFVYDDNDPKVFYVYPGVAENVDSFVEVVYSAVPATVSISDNLSVGDIYSNAVMNYVLYMAYMKDSEYAANASRAGSHYQLFSADVTGKAQVDTITTPNLRNARQNPSLPVGMV